MWRAPRRPDNRISQSYADGLASIYAVTADAAQPGRKPVETLTLKVTLSFDERRVGVQRYYQAAQALSRVDRVVRVPKPAGVEIAAQDRVRVTGSDALYRVEQVQSVPDVYPASLDLTLALVEPGTPPISTEGGDGNG